MSDRSLAEFIEAVAKAATGEARRMRAVESAAADAVALDRLRAETAALGGDPSRLTTDEMEAWRATVSQRLTGDGDLAGQVHGPHRENGVEHYHDRTGRPIPWGPVRQRGPIVDGVLMTFRRGE